jgi:hypothetical protein
MRGQLDGDSGWEGEEGGEAWVGPPASERRGGGREVAAGGAPPPRAPRAGAPAGGARLGPGGPNSINRLGFQIFCFFLI